MNCRIGCGACCIALSISSSIPGMPRGKPAGVRCVQLSVDNLCLLYGETERPAVCANLKPSRQMCGAGREEALEFLRGLEEATKPAS
jgi:hypothetical protein